MFKKVVKVVSGVGVSLLGVGSAMATAVYDPIVAAADATGLSTAAVAILAVVILIPLAFAGYKVVKRAINKA
jgi:hypothetical protein